MPYIRLKKLKKVRKNVLGPTIIIVPILLGALRAAAPA